MSKNNHTASDFVVTNKKTDRHTLRDFFYGWDADGAPVEEYPEPIKVKKKNDSTK